MLKENLELLYFLNARITGLLFAVANPELTAWSASTLLTEVHPSPTVLSVKTFVLSEAYRSVDMTNWGPTSREYNQTFKSVGFTFLGQIFVRHFCELLTFRTLPIPVLFPQTPLHRSTTQHFHCFRYCKYPETASMTGESVHSLDANIYLIKTWTPMGFGTWNQTPCLRGWGGVAIC